MSGDDRPTSADDKAERHADRVQAVTDGKEPDGTVAEVAESWQRSANRYRVDPASTSQPRILTSSELVEQREPIEAVVDSAQGELDRLYGLVRDAGYVVLLCDADGIAIDHRGEEQDAGTFAYWGIWRGGVWSEDVEGTNGIGTCAVEQRPITVHRTQHYRARHADLSCSGAPIFCPDGELIAVLDVSAFDPTLSESAHALTGVLTIAAARALEERLFRERFRREWIVALASPEIDDRAMLLAVDAHQRIVGADRAARHGLLLDERKLAAGVSLWGVFERDLALFQRRSSDDIPARLIIAGCHEPWATLLTPPETGAATPGGAGLALHARPRRDLLHTLRHLQPPPPVRGGLSPRSMQRVRAHIDAHIGDNIELTDLASVAGLSVFHFARQFKQTTGMTPHQYLLRQRIEQARKLLAKTELSLSEVAAATGFFDHSHFARHFRQMTGETPRAFRMASR